MNKELGVHMYQRCFRFYASKENKLGRICLLFLILFCFSPEFYSCPFVMSKTGATCFPLGSFYFFYVHNATYKYSYQSYLGNLLWINKNHKWNNKPLFSLCGREKHTKWLLCGGKQWCFRKKLVLWHMKVLWYFKNYI